MSTKITTQLDDPAVKAFNILKDNLIAQVELVQPDYNKKFTLTTDASDIAIGAVLSQDNKPITFISKTLNKTGQLYGTNKKGLLSIIWKWYSFIESFTQKIIYKPGTTNVVADALSPIKINNITNNDIEQSISFVRCNT